MACCGEDGLLDVAFHSQYAQNRLFFVSYVEDVDGVAHTVIARYQALPGGRFADPHSAVRLMKYPRLTFAHNAGEIEFGPDGFLYISSGDGGGAIYRLRSSWPRPALSSANPAVSVAGGDPFRMVLAGSGFSADGVS